MAFKAEMGLSPPQKFSVYGRDFNKQLITVTENKLVHTFTITFFFLTVIYFFLLVMLRIWIYGINTYQIYCYLQCGPI